jgi:hypothetical protein
MDGIGKYCLLTVLCTKRTSVGVVDYSKVEVRYLIFRLNEEMNVCIASPYEDTHPWHPRRANIPSRRISPSASGFQHASTLQPHVFSFRT